MSAEVGNVGEAAPTSVSTPTMLQTAGTAFSVIPGPVGTIASLFSASGAVSNLPNYALVAVGAILALGALLISSKETVIQVASTAARVAA